MLRFIMQHGQATDWSAVASSVATALPQSEAFDLLVLAPAKTVVGHTSNIAQAISMTKHPEAEATLRQYLAAVWSNQALWEPDDFLNWVAFDATTCIAHLIDLAFNLGCLSHSLGKHARLQPETRRIIFASSQVEPLPHRASINETEYNMQMLWSRRSRRLGGLQCHVPGGAGA